MNNLVKFLKEQKVKETGAFSKGVNKGLNIAISAIKNPQICPTIEQPTWIPVTERLPSIRGTYLVFKQWKTSSKAIWHTIQTASFANCLSKIDEYELSGKNYAGWYGYDSEYGYFEMEDVTHWMPLPQPPKGDE